MSKGKADDAKPAKKKRRWILRTVLIFFGVVILLIALAPTIISTPWGNGVVVGIIAEHLDRPVTMEKLDIGWFSGIELRGLHVANKNGDGHLVKLDKFSAEIGWLPLFAQELRIGNVRIEGLNVVISSDKNGRLSIADLFDEPPEESPSVDDDGDGLHWITNGYVNAVLTNGKIIYKDGKAGSEIVIDEIHVPIVLSRKVVIAGASLKINGGPVEIERIVYGLTGDAPPIEVKMKASAITITTAPPPGEPPAFIKPLLQIVQSIPLLHSEGTDVVGGTLEQLEIDIVGRPEKGSAAGFDLNGTMLMKAKGGKITTSKGVGRLLAELLGWNSMDVGRIETGRIRITGDKVEIIEQVTIKSPQADAIIKGGSILGGELDYRMVLNPKVSIPGDKKDNLAKMNALLSVGVLAFKITGPAGDPKVLPDPTGAVGNVFVSIFGKPTNNPFVRNGSVIGRFLDLFPKPPSLPSLPLPRLPGAGE